MKSALRNSRRRFSRCVIVMLLILPPFAVAQPAYEILELPPLNLNGDSHARGINDAGTVVGLARMPDGSYRAARWDEGIPVDLGAMTGFQYSHANDIRNDGVVFGRSGDSCQLNDPTIWQSSVPHPLPDVDRAHVEVYVTNETGVAIGEAYNSCTRPWNDTAVRWQYVAQDDNWVVSLLPPLTGDPESGAWGVNDAGVVIGFSGNSAGTAHLRACQWVGGAPSLLADLGGDYSIGIAINSAGRFAGYSRTSGGTYRAYYFDGATAVNLGTLPGYAYSAATSLNDAGTVIGFAFNGSTEDTILPYWFPNSNHRAFIWRDGVMYDANALILPSSGWTLLQSLTSINNRGQIAGIGVRNGKVRGFVLTPILPGDLNCDLAVDLADVPHFVEALLATGNFTGCDVNRADMSQDGLIDGGDTRQFVAALLAP